MANYLADGFIPAHIAGLTGPGGRPGPGPDLSRDKGIAAAYIQAAQGGWEYNGKMIIIEDKRPIRTVRRAYRISEHTAINWKSEVIPPVFGEDYLDANMLSKFLREAGERYQEATTASKGCK